MHIATGMCDSNSPAHSYLINNNILGITLCLALPNLYGLKNTAPQSQLSIDPAYKKAFEHYITFQKHILHLLPLRIQGSGNYHAYIFMKSIPCVIWPLMLPAQNRYWHHPWEGKKPLQVLHRLKVVKVVLLD